MPVLPQRWESRSSYCIRAFNHALKEVDAAATLQRARAGGADTRVCDRGLDQWVWGLR